MISRRLISLARTFSGRPQPKILMYHRVAELPCDPWGLAVHPARFAEQLDILVRHRSPMDLAEFVSRLRQGTLPPDAVAVTIDDGYADTLEQAQPALVAAEVPATLFLATSFIDSSRGFWSDELANLLLRRTDPEVIRFRLPGFDEFTLGPPEPGDFDPTWRAWTEPRTRRQGAFVAVYGFLKSCRPDNIARHMASLRAVLGQDAVSIIDRAMTETEVCRLISNGFVTLGGHTANHPYLPALTAEQQREEASSGKLATERLAGARVPGFAYPFGGMCDSSRRVVRECGFDFACTTDSQAPMHRSSEIFALPRMMVSDVGGRAFQRALGS